MSCLGKLFGSCVSQQNGASDDDAPTEKVTLRTKSEKQNHFSVGGYEEYRSQVSCSAQSRSEITDRLERYTVQSCRSDSKTVCDRKSSLSKISETSTAETKVLQGTIRKQHNEHKGRVVSVISTDTETAKSSEIPIGGVEQRSSDVFVSFKTLSTRVQMNERNATYENTILLANPQVASSEQTNEPNHLAAADSKKASVPPPIPQKRHDSAVVMFGTLRKPSASRVPVSPIEESVESGTADCAQVGQQCANENTDPSESKISSSNLRKASSSDASEPEADYRTLGPLRENLLSSGAPTYTNLGTSAAKVTRAAEEKAIGDEGPYRRLADMKCANRYDKLEQSAVYVNDASRNSWKKHASDSVDPQAPKLVYAELDLPPTRADSPVRNARRHSPSRIEYLDGTAIDFERTEALAMLAIERERMLKSGQLGNVEACSRPIISSDGGRRFVSRNNSLNQHTRAAGNAIISRPPMITPKRRNSEARLLLSGRGMLPSERSDTTESRISDYISFPLKEEKNRHVLGGQAAPSIEVPKCANKAVKTCNQQSAMSSSLPSSSMTDMADRASYINFSECKTGDETFEEKWRAAGPTPTAELSANVAENEYKTFSVTSPSTDSSPQLAGRNTLLPQPKAQQTVIGVSKLGDAVDASADLNDTSAIRNRPQCIQLLIDDRKDAQVDSHRTDNQSSVLSQRLDDSSSCIHSLSSIAAFEYEGKLCKFLCRVLKVLLQKNVEDEVRERIKKCILRVEQSFTEYQEGNSFASVFVSQSDVLTDSALSKDGASVAIAVATLPSYDPKRDQQRFKDSTGSPQKPTDFTDQSGDLSVNIRRARSVDETSAIDIRHRSGSLEDTPSDLQENFAANPLATAAPLIDKSQRNRIVQLLTDHSINSTEVLKILSLLERDSSVHFCPDCPTYYRTIDHLSKWSDYVEKLN